MLVQALLLTGFLSSKGRSNPTSLKASLTLPLFFPLGSWSTSQTGGQIYRFRDEGKIKVDKQKEEERKQQEGNVLGELVWGGISFLTEATEVSNYLQQLMQTKRTEVAEHIVSRSLRRTALVDRALSMKEAGSNIESMGVLKGATKSTGCHNNGYSYYIEFSWLYIYIAIF